VVRLEERLGYTHKGIEKLLAEVDRGGPTAFARVYGDSTVCLLGWCCSARWKPRSSATRRRARYGCGGDAELERIAIHLGDVGAICNDAAFRCARGMRHPAREESARLRCGLRTIA